MQLVIASIFALFGWFLYSISTGAFSHFSTSHIGILGAVLCAYAAVTLIFLQLKDFIKHHRRTIKDN